MTWLDKQPPRRTKDAMTRLRGLIERDAAAKQCWDYAGGEEEFALWLHITHTRCMARYSVGLFDLADFEFRSLYEAGDSPAQALAAAIAHDGTVDLVGGEL
jgi:hypothetical protein